VEEKINMFAIHITSLVPCNESWGRGFKKVREVFEQANFPHAYCSGDRWGRDGDNTQTFFKRIYCYAKGFVTFSAKQPNEKRPNSRIKMSQTLGLWKKCCKFAHKTNALCHGD
jgi:hypothetical protein